MALKTKLQNLHEKIDAFLTAVSSLNGRIDLIEKKIDMFVV